jgi:predicted nucleic acid-binding protein
VKVVLDTSVLIFLVYPTASAPQDPATGKPVQHCQERIEGLLEDLDQGDTELIVPTPVLSELLILAGSRQVEILAAVTNKKSVRVADFNQMAAVENAALRRKKELTKKKRSETKKEVSFDLQIVAIARVAQADRVLTDDEGVIARCKLAGIETMGIADIPIPASRRQITLELPSPEGGGDAAE